MRFIKIDDHIVNLRHLVDISKHNHEDCDGQTVFYINIKTLVSSFNVLFKTEEERDESFKRLFNELD